MMACATPPPSRMARAILPTTSTTPRMPSPSPKSAAPHRSVFAQGNRAVKLGLLLPSTAYRRSSAQQRTRWPRTAARGKRKVGLLWEGSVRWRSTTFVIFTRRSCLLSVDVGRDHTSVTFDGGDAYPGQVGGRGQ